LKARLITVWYVIQRQLSDAFVELGEIDQALDDVLGLLHEVEADLLHSDTESGDPNCCEVLANRVQVRYSLHDAVGVNNRVDV